MAGDDIAALRDRLRDFAARRDWEQYHTPKNLVMALAAEAGELLDLFQWLTAEQSTAITDHPEVMNRVRDEIADVTIYLVRLAHVLDVDLVQAAHTKMDKNAQRFPEDRQEL